MTLEPSNLEWPLAHSTYYRVVLLIRPSEPHTVFPPCLALRGTCDPNTIPHVTTHVLHPGCVSLVPGCAQAWQPSRRSWRVLHKRYPCYGKVYRTLPTTRPVSWCVALSRVRCILCPVHQKIMWHAWCFPAVGIVTRAMLVLTA